jgi:DNA invertase Pin-like site-specific DNA recombinase
MRYNAGMNTSTPTTAVAYYRVSTRKQGISGLGIEGQETAVSGYCRSAGLTLAKTFTEVESGKLADRPQLLAALAHCRRTGARLVVAKLDRLSRNVAFLSSLMEAKADFTACDNPTANRLTLHVLAAVAENEAKAISERTTAALAAAKARGTLLGSARPGHGDGREDRRQAGMKLASKIAAKLRTDKAKAAIADLLPIMRAGRAEGKTFQAIADELNADQHTTSTGKTWTAVGVIQTLRRFPE